MSGYLCHGREPITESHPRVKRSEAFVRAPNSILLVGDPDGQPPTSLSGGLVAATSSCIAVGSLSSGDGETRVCIAAATDDHPAHLAFDGHVALDSRVLAVYDVTRIEIRSWANVSSEQMFVIIERSWG